MDFICEMRSFRRALLAAGARLGHLSRLLSRNTGAWGSVLLSLFSVAIIWLGAWHMAREDAGRTEAAAYRATENLTRAFEENIIRLIQAHDQLLVFART